MHDVIILWHFPFFSAVALLCLLKIFNTNDPVHKVDHFDIITYTWGKTVPPYNCGIDGVNWNVPIQEKKLEDIKRLMIKANVQYLWADCICINQDDEKEKAVEIPKMYQYYKSARKCYILMDMDEVWAPQEIVDNLHFIDHILSHMGGAALATEAKLTENMTNRLTMWANENWNFRIDASIVRSAAIDMGVLNCYSTCISRVRSLFENDYFTRVWTFQEMLLGKNITMYGVHSKTLAIYPLGDLETWMDLATDSNDKTWKLQGWIETSRVLKTASVNAILNIIDEDCLALDILQKQVKGLISARTDIIAGGPSWWYENRKGVSNIFSAISITPRKCGQKVDIFRGLLGIFSGLFTPEEVERDLSGDDIEKISFAFFKQLSIKTGHAWTKLAISSEERGVYDWIPVAAKNSKLLSTDIFAAVVNLGRLNQKGLAKAVATTGLNGAPRKYMKIQISKENRGFQFTFKGCNCGKTVKTGLFSSEPIPTYDQPRSVSGDETGRILVQCAIILGSLIDPGHDVVEYRGRLLHLPCLCKLRIIARAKVGYSPSSFWRGKLSITGISIFIFEAITAVEGGSLGNREAMALEDDRIVMRDGLGLVQVDDVGRAFNLAAFGGDIDAYKSYASGCRSTKLHKALVREELTHSITDLMRNYGYVETGGSGNLLICRTSPVGQYKIIGVCIDVSIESKKGNHTVTIR
ncbi:uncharacterized protein LY89DRAFT_699440 [Mollisia scopiformis]|uniref:Heterokaryon incompatibility domain-containing protein n=1 Tax=Mollisia scopiformis TaxID=149040 RepID=A0A194WYP8_MOLSC|nr:uncharacterized protein LY89DRAFT_699440 [Mollisia scopiformis]KUJ12814.1 hypothetical protein LY89DRAFT_699440 [Mollisia scopiformis]